MRRILSTLLVCTLATVAFAAARGAPGDTVETGSYYYSDIGSDLAGYLIIMAVVPAGLYLLLERPFKEKDPHYETLKKEVKRNEAAGKGDIEVQTRALLDDGVRLEAEASTLENSNAALAVKVAQFKEAAKFWRVLVREDEDFIFKETHEIEKE